MPKRRLYGPVVVAGTDGRPGVRGDTRDDGVGRDGRTGGSIGGGTSGRTRSGGGGRGGAPRPQHEPPQKPTQPRRRRQQQQQPTVLAGKARLGSEILLKLSNACRKHSAHHADGDRRPRRGPPSLPTPGRGADDGGSEEHVPDVCRKAIHSLRGLIPKLERAIAPKTHGNGNQDRRRPRHQERGHHQGRNQDGDDGGSDDDAASLEDVLHLCEFYNSVLVGYYCPHMPHLFHLGREVGTILDKVRYLLCHLLSPALFRTPILEREMPRRDDESNNGGCSAPSDDHDDVRDRGREDHTCDAKTPPPAAGLASASASSSSAPSSSAPSSWSPSSSTSPSSSLQARVLDSLCHTIARLLGFVVEDHSRGLHRSILLDLIYLLEDCAVLEGSSGGIVPSATSNRPSIPTVLLPARLDVFNETAPSSASSQSASDDENRQQPVPPPKACYTLDVHDMGDVHLLQTAALKVLNLYLLAGASKRLASLPEPAAGTVASSPPPPYLPGGDYDLVLPPGTARDVQVVSSLLVAIKPVLLLLGPDSPRLPGGPRRRGEESSFSSHLSLERRCSAVETLILLSEDWHCCGGGPACLVVETAILASRAVHAYVQRRSRRPPPPPATGGQDGNGPPVGPQPTRSRYGDRLAALVDRIVLHPPPSSPATGARGTIHATVLTVFLDCLQGMAERLDRYRRPTWPGSGSSYSVDAKILQTIHAITSSSPNMLAVAVDYCTSKDLFPHLFALLVPPPTSSTRASASPPSQWALPVLGLFLTAMMAVSSHGDGLVSNNRMMVNSACLQSLNQHSCKAPSGDAEGGQHQSQTVDGIGEGETSIQSDMASNVGVGDGAVASDVRSVGTKRKLNALSPGPTPGRNKMYRSPLRPLSMSPAKRRVTANAARGRRELTGACSHHQDDEPFPCAPGWIEALHEFCCRALEGGRNLQNFILAPDSQAGNTEGKVNRKNNEEVEKALENANCLLHAVRLLLRLIHADANVVLGTGGESAFSEIWALAQQLAQYLLTFCDSFASSFTTASVDNESASVEIADVLFRCGFTIHFASSSSPLHGNIGKLIREFLHSVSCLSLRIIQQNPKRSSRLGFCDAFAQRSGIPSYFLQNAKDTHNPDGYIDCFSPFCRSTSDTNADSSNHSVMVIDTLPLFTKAALLAALNPVSNNPSGDSMARTVETVAFCGQHTLNVFIGLIYKDLCGNCSEMNDETENLVASILHLTPMLVAPRHLNQMSGDGGSKCANGSTAALRSNIVQFLETILDPLTEHMKTGKKVILQGLLAAVGLLQDFAASRSSKGAQVEDAYSVLMYVQSRYRCQSISKGLQNEESSDLSGVVAYLAQKIGKTECPRSRYLLWMCLVRYCRSTSPSELRQQLFNSSTIKGLETIEGTRRDICMREVFSWIVAVPFSDVDRCLRRYTSREIIPLLMTNDFSFLLSYFASDDDFQDYCIYARREGGDRSEQSTFKLLQAADEVATGLFREIDRLLNESCGFSDSQLSLTMARPGIREKSQSDPKIPLQYVATRILSSMCSVANLSHPIGKNIFEKALLRLIRAWAAPAVGKGTDFAIPDLLSTSNSKAIAFGAMASLSESRDLSICLSGHRSWTYFPCAIFCDIILLNNASSREEQFVLLERFLLAFFTGPKQSLALRRSFDEVIELVDDGIPSILAQFVNEKDDDLLRLSCCFKLFMKEKRKRKNATCTGHSLVIGRSNSTITERKSVALTMGLKELQDLTRDMCLGLMDEVLPLVLVNSDQHEALPLKFLTRVIAPTTLIDIVKGREQRILKGIAWELGRDPYRVGSAVRGMRTAAIACQTGDLAGEGQQEVLSGTVAAQGWVTKHFMYLIVNMVQLHWNTRTAKHRLQALRCLFVLLDFLNPVESAQYFPQVMATVNAAIIDDCDRVDYSVDDISETEHLRLQATKCLSRFVRVATKNHLGTVIDNLTTIVVSLIPVLEDGGINPEKTGKTASEEAREEAVALLEFLTNGEIVRRFRKEFSEIPFLPSSPALDNVHKGLRENGVDFDNLLLLSTATAGSQHGTRRESSTSDTGSRSTSLARNGDKVSALQKRLAMICTLLDNENTSVRSVAMEHLADLLRANRDSFHILVDNEGSVSIRNYLTVVFPDGASKKSEASGNVTDMVERLIRRCTIESDQEVVIKLAACLGEIGAIGEHRLEDVSLFKSAGDESFALYHWRLDKPPWQSHPTKYELQLVTKHLVTALKAAPSSEEQHKIAFTIQQLLVLLDAAGRQNEKESNSKDASTAKRRGMSKWLLNQLVEANVNDTVEPFWLSEFNEKTDKHKTKKPPFFKLSTSYSVWIGTFCRWMIIHAKNCALSRWKDFFFACRTAVKTPVGLDTAEFLLPLLVADRIYFGSSEEFKSICQEFLDLLDFDSNGPKSPMDHSDRQKAVSGFFSMFDTMTFWAERETEERHRSKRMSTSLSSRGSGKTTEIGSIGSHWPAEETITRIYELIGSIPLHAQAKAAAKVGMHARALRLLEMADRKESVEEIFESSSSDVGVLQTIGRTHIDINLLKSVLASYDDFETMNSVGDDPFSYNPLLHISRAIQRKEAVGEYEGALQDYERALHFQKDFDGSLEKGALQCLLELGRFESVLDRVTSGSRVYRGKTESFAIEAAWRLGRWETLSTLLEGGGEVVDPRRDSADIYREEIGKVMLCLREQDASGAEVSLRTSRKAVMESLACVARESFSRAYADIVKLHCIRELEDAAMFLCHRTAPSVLPLSEIAESTLHDGWAWEGRVRWATSHAASTIMGTRMGIARLGQEPIMEASLFLSMGKHARRHCMRAVAENYFSSAEERLASIPVVEFTRNPTLEGLVNEVQVQYAKLKNSSGENGDALKILGQDMVQKAFSKMSEETENPEHLSETAVEYERKIILNLFGAFAAKLPKDKVLSDRFARRLLRTTQWTVDGGMKSGSEIVERFRAVHKLSPEWEKGHFHFAKYLNSLVSRRFDKESTGSSEEGNMNAEAICRDKSSQKFILLAIEHYSAALKLDLRHVYQALPRLLSLWFDFVSIYPEKGREDGTSPALKRDQLKTLAENQDQINQFMAKNLKVIPPAAFYTAIPQLVSRVIHQNAETALIVKKILERVLFKFPQQAMWHLAWLKGSKNAERSRIGEEIFKEAQKVLIKTKHSDMANLLGASGSLFKFLQELARHSGDKTSSQLSIRPWKGLVDLTEFLPPVQAALSISPFKAMKSKSGSREFFPRIVPRMRSFSSRVVVMTSKARPKKLIAFAVPGTWKHANIDKSSFADGKGSAAALNCDIGEIHFLVKQEAKGDLRKDARVQDLNNVINRLMTSPTNSSSTPSSRTRRLRVRTFAVTCLSEDTGILEWVPQTDSLRNAIVKSYNPQTSPLCPRRRGSRVANFGDAALRAAFERCQSMFYKNGDIVQAAKMFEILCLKPYPPVLYWWFVQNFHDPHAWYEARVRFTLSAAAWSAIGHVIGLGDRHSENILVDTASGGLLHVDFDCIFDKGLNLPRPEVVPFRLTPNIVDAFGPAGADGMFTSGMQSSLGVLRENRDTLLSVLEPFVKDPVIDWKRHRSQQASSAAAQQASTGNNHHNNGNASSSSGEAKRSIQIIKERLNGIYNLRNPNLRTYRHIIVSNRQHDEDDETMMAEIPLSVEGQVKKLIVEASKNENLVQLYVGWMPWV